MISWAEGDFARSCRTFLRLGGDDQARGGWKPALRHEFVGRGPTPSRGISSQLSSRRMIGLGGEDESHERNSATVNPARSNIACVPT